VIDLKCAKAVSIERLACDTLEEALSTLKAAFDQRGFCETLFVACQTKTPFDLHTNIKSA
jgi:hypothetical protein